MKKYYLSILSLATMALVFGSCQRDELESNVVGGEVEVSLSAGLPAGLMTYGPSHLGGASNVSQDEYDLRYILEVYDGDNKVYKDTTIDPSDFTSSNASFSARLLAKKYKFILWADFVTNGTEDDLYYNTGDLRNIGYTGLVNPAKLSDDAVDAYYKVVDVDLTTGGKKLSGIKLQRPFGKIRFVATDALSDGVSQTETPASVKIDFRLVPDQDPQEIAAAFSRAEFSAGRSSPARIAMIAMVMRSSIRVKNCFFRLMFSNPFSVPLFFTE